MLKEEGKLETIKITDFGFAKRLAEARGGGSALQTLLGTPQYVPPEVVTQIQSNMAATAPGEIVRGRYDGAAIDIWSFGVILFQALCGSLPFAGMNCAELYSRIKRGVVSMDSPEWAEVGADAKSLVTRALSVDPAKRPTGATTAPPPAAHALARSRRCGCMPRAHRQAGTATYPPPSLSLFRRSGGAPGQ